MTGFYVRVKRGGSWMNIEVEHLTDEEFDDLEQSDPSKGWAWTKALSRWIKAHVVLASDQPIEQDTGV